MKVARRRYSHRRWMEKEDVVVRLQMSKQVRRRRRCLLNMRTSPVAVAADSDQLPSPLQPVRIAADEGLAESWRG